MRLDVHNISGGKTGRTVELPESVFGVTPNEHAVYLSVKLYLANQRQGTHKSKERSEISGSTRKLHRQKGTGGSRKGDINSPLFPGGGRVFGPKPRDYSFKINKKVKRLAKLSALSAKCQAGKVVILEDFQLDAPKTKKYAAILGGLNLSDVRTLLVLPEYNSNIYLSGRNSEKSGVTIVNDLNTYQIVQSNTLILSEGAINKIVETMNSSN